MEVGAESGEESEGDEQMEAESSKMGVAGGGTYSSDDSDDE